MIQIIVLNYSPFSDMAIFLGYVVLWGGYILNYSTHEPKTRKRKAGVKTEERENVLKC